MASEGPTTTGSINATLKLNADEFERKIDEAAAQADAMDGRTIHTKIDVASGGSNGASAVASDLERVVQAEGKAKTSAEALAKAHRDMEVADNRWQIAQLNLEKVEKDVNATEQAKLRARNQLIQATAATEKAETALAAAVRAAEAAENDTAGATDRSTESKKRNAEASKAQFDWIQALIAASPALLAGADSLAAATVGLGLGFAGMGAAGVLAIEGIKTQMQSGTSVGQAYSDGLGVLKGDLDQLAQTAAVSMLNSFSHAVDDVNGHMSVLNYLTANMASALGNVAGGVLHTFLDGLQAAQPLIKDGAFQLSQFIGWLDQFATSQGFQSFITYAVANLPSVTHFLEDLVTTAGRIIEAFAPVGPVVIGLLDGISQVLNALPLPVLAGFVTMVTTMPTAINVAKAAIGLFGDEFALFGMKANLAIPVVGIFLAAITGLGAGLLSATMNQQGLTTATQQYTSAVEADNNAVGEHTRKLLEQTLISSGAAQAAARLGIGIGDLTDAALGNGKATSYINGLLDTHRQKLQGAAHDHAVMSAANQQTKSDVDAVTGAIKGNNSQINDAVAKAQLYAQAQEQDAAATGRTKDSADQLQDALTALANKYGVTAQQIQQAQQANHDANTEGGLQVATMEALASKYGDTAVSVANLAAAQQASTGDFSAAILKMQEENDAAGILKASLDALNGKAISAAQAQNNFDSQLVNMGTHVDKVGNQVQFTTNNIGDMSAASVALRGQLNGQVAALEQVVEANGGLNNSTGDAKKQMEAMRQQIIDNAVAHGVDRDAVTQYIDQVLKIPDSVPPTKVEADTSQAQAALAGVTQALDRIDGRVVNVYTQEHIQSVRDSGDNATANAMQQANQFATGNAGYAYGGYVARLATGGTHPFSFGTDTVPAMLAQGEFVVPRASAQALHRDSPGALEYIRSHGTLPPSQGGSGPVYLTAYFENPITGEQVQATVRAVARDEIGKAARDAAAMRRA